MEVRNLTCINCPLGCSLTVEMENGQVGSVSGNTCKRGEIYAHKELTNPTRIVTSTVKVVNGKSETVSVKTKSDIPKELIFECIQVLQNVQVEAPIHIGDVVVANIANTGVDIVATKNVQV